MPGLTYPMAVFILVLQEDATGHRAGLDATAPGAAGPAGRAAGHRGHTQLADRRAAGERTAMPSMPGAAPASRREADVSVVRKAVQRMEYGTLTLVILFCQATGPRRCASGWATSGCARWCWRRAPTQHSRRARLLDGADL